MTTVYFGAGEIARELGVSAHLVGVWQIRYGPDRTPEQIAKAPSFPAPDVEIGEVRPIAGWAKERMPEIRAWKASRPRSKDSALETAGV